MIIREIINGKLIEREATKEELAEYEKEKNLTIPLTDEQRITALEEQLASYKKELSTVKGNITKLQNELKEVKNNG